MAEVALCLEFRKTKSAEEVAAICAKSLEDTKGLLWDLAINGGCLVGEEDGADKYWLEIWVPGHMELIVNHPHKENIDNFTQIGEAFRLTEKEKLRSQWVFFQ